MGDSAEIVSGYLDGKQPSLGFIYYHIQEFWYICIYIICFLIQYKCNVFREKQIQIHVSYWFHRCPDTNSPTSLLHVIVLQQKASAIQVYFFVLDPQYNSNKCILGSAAIHPTTHIYLCDSCLPLQIKSKQLISHQPINQLEGCCSHHQLIFHWDTERPSLSLLNIVDQITAGLGFLDCHPVLVWKARCVLVVFWYFFAPQPSLTPIFCPG
jgi:hypothetical protein